jgi:tetratricopeptide (TPR) repeat protein
MSDVSKAQRMAALPAVLTTTLGVLAGLSVTAGGAASVYVLVHAGQGGRSAGTDVLMSVGCLLAGVVVGCLLWLAGHLVRQRGREALLHASAERTLQRRQSQRAGGGLELQPVRSPPPPAAPPVVPAAPPAASVRPAPTAAANEAESVERRLLRDILAQLRELNENLLLTPEQRVSKWRHQRELLARRLTEQVERAIEAGEFSRAEGHLAALERDLPERADHARSLRARLVEVRDGAKLAEIEARSREVCDLMAVSSFDRAEAVARELRDKYPDEADVIELLQRVRREGEKFTSERRDRLYREVERLAEARQWRAALDAARQFLGAFPDGVSADALRAMMPTIEDNARIEEVREIRDHIRDLIERRRYAEALEAAEDVIRRFPDTRAAGELKEQLGRLRGLSRSPAGDSRARR